MAVKTLERLVLNNREIAGLKRIGANVVVMERTSATPSFACQAQRSPADYPPAATATPWTGRTGRSASALLASLSGSRRSIRLVGGWGCGMATTKPTATAGRAERLAGWQALRGGHTPPARRGMPVSAQPGPIVGAFTASLRGRLR